MPHKPHAFRGSELCTANYSLEVLHGIHGPRFQPIINRLGFIIQLSYCNRRNIRKLFGWIALRTHQRLRLFRYPRCRSPGNFGPAPLAEETWMDAWFHCENPYPFVPDSVLDQADSVRASLPNRYCVPEIAARLFEETLDEYLLCDELGLNITS